MNRFDPALCAGSCPVCGVSTSANPGDPTPMHQYGGQQDQATCSGSGMTSN